MYLWLLFKGGSQGGTGKRSNGNSCSCCYVVSHDGNIMVVTIYVDRSGVSLSG